MKVVEQQTRGVELVNVGETRAFSFAANGDLMKNIITSIYSKREKTVVRELIANALDAHAAIGKDTAIDVFLPTNFDPTFIVRDYGAGMSHDFVMHLYSAIGFSTKSDTNDQTGMFGVGSKSPLSISDTFTVRCFDKPGWNGAPDIVEGVDLNETGRVRMYTVSILDNNIPQISHTFNVPPRDEDKIEEGGTEVRVPVSVYDRERLLDGLVEQQFCWFDKKINFGGAESEVKDRFFQSVMQLSPNMYVAHAPKKNLNESILDWRVFVRQGSAVYPFDKHTMFSSLSKEETIALKALNDNKRYVLIDLPIGTVDVTMAREDIRYNETSIKNLALAVKEAVAVFQEQLVESVGDAKNGYEALNRLADAFIDDPLERTQFKARKLVASLLPLVMHKVRDNYEAYWATLPKIKTLVPKMVVNTFGFSDEVLDADGKPVMEEIEVPPPKLPPFVSVRLSSAQFTESIVRLHPANIYAGWMKDGADIHIDTKQDSYEFTVPCIAYVIPAYLGTWKERVAAHVNQVYRSNDFPANSREGLPCVIIRCAKKRVDDVKAVLLSRGLVDVVFDDSVLPVVASTTTRAARNTSKTCVWQYDMKKREWAKDKVEADWDAPAYYVVRSGTGNSAECYSSEPGNFYLGRTMRETLGEHGIGVIVNTGLKLGVLDPDYPIYRITDKQHARMKRNADSEWVYLPPQVAPHVEAKLKEHTDYRKFVDSGITDTRFTEQANFVSFVEAALDLGRVSPDQDKAFYIVDRLAQADPLFKAIMGIRVIFDNKEYFADELLHSKYNEIDDVAYALFGRDYNAEVINGLYKKATEDFNRVYSPFAHMSAKHDARMIKMMAMLVDTYLSGDPEIADKTELMNDEFINHFSNLFQNKLDSIRKMLQDQKDELEKAA